MAYENFRDLHRIGDYMYAKVDCRYWVFMTATHDIYRCAGERYWRHLDDGSFTPDAVSRMEGAFKALKARGESPRSAEK